MCSSDLSRLPDPPVTGSCQVPVQDWGNSLIGGGGVGVGLGVAAGGAVGVAVGGVVGGALGAVDGGPPVPPGVVDALVPGDGLIGLPEPATVEAGGELAGATWFSHATRSRRPATNMAASGFVMPRLPDSG